MEVPYRSIAATVNRLLEVRRGERAAEEADRRLLASLIEGSPNGVLVVGRDGRVRFVNRAFRELFDVRVAAVGRRPAEVVHVPEVLDLLDLAGHQASEDEIVTATGARDVALRPVVTESGEVAVLAQDITRFRAAERARTAFVANVSHELRTPMAAILGYADELLAASEELPERHRKLVEAVARNGRRLRDTFEGLMHLARVEARSGQLRLETLRLAPLLVEAVASASELAAGKGVGFELRCDQEVRAATNADAFDVIMNNLASNAVKYTPHGGAVVIDAGLVEGEVQIVVRDDGIGIDPAHHDRIFERFFRVDEGRAREVGGTGLGLAMVKHLCLATGARIGVRSAVGRGSTFSLTLAPPGPDAPDEGEE
jgi:two-component system, OmpR family, phosphate regulon sensor histidine kinase PhoR